MLSADSPGGVPPNQLELWVGTHPGLASANPMGAGLAAHAPRRIGNYRLAWASSMPRIIDREAEERLAFFRSLPASEQLRLATWFREIIESGKLGRYEWRMGVDEKSKAASA